MKVSKDWVRQPMVDEAADALVVPGTCNVADVTAYQVGKALQCAANSALHAKVRDWRRRRQTEATATQIAVPPRAEAEFGGMLDQMTADAKALWLRTIESVGSEFDRSKTLRVVDAERRRDAAEDETDAILKQWEKTEAELCDAHGQIDQLEKALSAGVLREERLAGRIEQLAADLAATLRRGEPDAEPGTPINRVAETSPLDTDAAIRPVTAESGGATAFDAD